jgi:hypothetical protein
MSTSTKAFLAAIDIESKNAILDSIAKHCGITREAAYDEVTDPEAEHLLDYMVAPFRLGASVLMQKHGFK